MRLENLEINYKGKEVTLFYGRTKNPENVFKENVKINRIKSVYVQSKRNDFETIEVVSEQQLLAFIIRYIEAYRKEANSLIGEPPLGAGYPPSLINRVYLDSRLIRAYLLKDSVVISDVVEAPTSKNFEPDKSIEILPAQLSQQMSDGTTIEIVKANQSLQSFILTATLGLFKINAGEKVLEYGRHSGLRKFTIQNAALKKERHVSQIDSYLYIDKSGWEPRNAWLYAFYDVRYDIASAIAEQEKVGKTYTVKGGGKITATPTDKIWREYDIKTKIGSKLAQFSADVQEFEQLLTECGESGEGKFLEYLDNHLHLLDIYAVFIQAQPFIEIPEKELCSIKGIGRIPDYIAKYRDDTYLLIELERPSKPVFVGKNNQPSSQLNQSVNQTSTWDEIIRCFGKYLTKYPGIQNHRNLVVIGRENAQRFNSFEEFRSELNRLNQMYKSIATIVTFDELTERAKVGIARIRAIQSSLG